MAQGRAVGQIMALRPETTCLAQPGQAPPGLLLLQEGIDRLADQGALAAATAQGQGLQSLALVLREMDLSAKHGSRDWNCWCMPHTSTYRRSHPHHHRLARAFPRLLESQRSVEPGAPCCELRIKAPLDLGEHQEPEPDLAVLAARADAWLDAHPTAADTLLVVEVADASLVDDLDTKLRLYQQTGIANYWVVDVREPMAFFLLQGKTDQPLLTALGEQVEALVAELRALA